MHRPLRSIAAGEGLGRAIQVTPPADSLGVAWVLWKFPGHGTPPALAVRPQPMPATPTRFDRDQPFAASTRSWIRFLLYRQFGDSMKRPRLRAVEPRSGSRLELTFTNGQHFILDMSEALKAYPGLAPLAKRKAFDGVVLGDGGWSVEWPELDIQIGSDTLLLDALAQTAPDENTRLFIRWRLRHRMTLDQAAEALGVSARSISRYSSGREAVPLTLALACLDWETLEQRAA